VPGVYILSASGALDLSKLPHFVGSVGLSEFHPPPIDTLPPMVEALASPEFVTGHDVRLAARVVADAAADSVLLFIRRVAGDWYHRYPMRATGGYRFETVVPADSVRPGPYEFVVVHFAQGSATTFPGAQPGQPWDWNFPGRVSWRASIVAPGTPVALFDPGTDANRLTFTRIGDAGRQGLFNVSISPVTGRPVFQLGLPAGEGGRTLEDYTASLVVRKRIQARAATVAGADAVRLRLRGLGPRQVLQLTLMEDDGTSWTAGVPVDSSWSEPRIPLSDFRAGRGALLPQGFPGQWNYWVGPAAGRGGAGDRLRLEHLERLQLSLRPETGMTSAPRNYGVEVEWVHLTSKE
jgi:hypothetical protein